MRQDLEDPHNQRRSRAASIIGFWLSSVVTLIGLVNTVSTKPAVDSWLNFLLAYPLEQLAFILAFVGSLSATYKFYLDQEGKEMLSDVKALAEANEQSGRKAVYNQWIAAAQIQDGAICRFYRNQASPQEFNIEDAIDAVLESIKTIFDSVYAESEVMSVNIAVPNSPVSPTHLKVLRRWPERGGATIGRELSVDNAEGWGFIEAFNTRRIKYLPNTQGTTSEHALYNSVLSIPVLDGTDTAVVVVFNVDSRRVRAFGTAADRIDERVDQAIQLAWPAMRLFGLLLLNPQVFSHYRSSGS